MVLAVVLVLIGLGVLTLGVRDLSRVRRLRREGLRAVGTVTAHELRPSGSSSIVVDYRDDLGVPHRMTSPLSSYLPTVGVGEPVTVRYVPGEPASAHLDDRRENTLGTAGLVVLGVGFTVAGVALALRGG
ncbi:DUF3592 domain-containing protein [Paractinoplanes maris]|uniref:DUF3592 domain-containing protein n=1 Tax=Paractinoplanes maris TaxID=1734446 RepID=UPI00202265F2|nr:DUF3592 domain-containing protein [Actinoplanes maris]